MTLTTAPSEVKIKGEEYMKKALRFVQIAVSRDRLFGVTKDGRIFTTYLTDPIGVKGWEPVYMQEESKETLKKSR